MKQLIQLTKPVSRRFVETKPKAGRDLEFVSHANVTQLLLAAVGPHNWSKVRDSDIFDTEGNLEASVWRLEVQIDGRWTVVESTGDYDGPSNNKSQGFRAQFIEANSYRRCAEKLGCCLELWVDGCQGTGMYVLHDHLIKKQEEQEKSNDSE